MEITKKRTAVAVAASLLFLTGCGPAETTSAEVAAPASSASTSVSADECTAAVEPYRALFKEILSSAINSGAKDDFAGARKALTDYAAKAREQAAKATDPALGAALERQAGSAEKMSKAADPTALDDPEWDAAAADLEKVCAEALTPTAAPGTPTTRVGPAGSACELPISFDLVALWKPSAVDLAKQGELAELYRIGPFEVVCEIDAKPAGEVGFLRVHLAPGLKGTPRSHLEKFVESESPEARKNGNSELKKAEYKEVTIGGEAAAEVTYEVYNKVLEHESKYSAFALNTAKGAVVVKLAPFGADEYANVLPAYELAKSSLAVN
ncbi:lipoprotein [Actinoplanes sp. GCM10030250]|uniref:lipoprotein n=1 Tax=Actinoplanes sp. GCM10030250 TaxID=3273376 RepID=UPI0036130015